jgi:hypothetical protein
MQPFTVLSAAEQVAKHLRAELLRGSLSGTMPGVYPMAAELGVNHKTVKAALAMLKEEGLVVGRGRGREPSIVPPSGKVARSGLRVALLMLDTRSRGQDYMIDLRHLLEDAGHVPFYPDKTLLDLGMDPKRIARFVRRTEADAWVVAAASREVLEWFAAQPLPAFALFGRRRELPIAGAGPDKKPPILAATRHLIELGHRRISLLVRRQHRLPQPGPLALAYLAELEAGGIQPGDFNLPDWQESQAGFQNLLESMFHRTPPTALILDEPFLFNAAVYFAAKRGLQVPEDISLICTDEDPSFDWCEPSVAHIRWNYRPVVRRIVRWANNVSHGKKDLRRTLTKAEFVEGGTVGVVPES